MGAGCATPLRRGRGSAVGAGTGGGGMDRSACMPGEKPGSAGGAGVAGGDSCGRVNQAIAPRLATSRAATATEAMIGLRGMVRLRGRERKAEALHAPPLEGLGRYLPATLSLKLEP